jgi:hypothetical protein
MSNTRAFLAKLVEAESPEEFMCLHPGTMETMEGEARSVEVKAGDKFVATGKIAAGLTGRLLVDRVTRFSHQPGLSGKRTNPAPIRAEQLPPVLLRTSNIGTEPDPRGFWAVFSAPENRVGETLESNDAGTLDEVPDAWKKLFTNSGAGDQSEIVLVKKNLRSSRELGTLVKSGPNAEIAGYFMKKTDGTPVGIIRYTGEGGKPWQLIQPSGEAVTKKEVNYRRLPSWRQPTRTYTDGQGKVVRYKDRNATERYEFQRRDVSLNEISNVISFADGIDLYAMKKDVARAAKHADRQAARAGQDSDIDNIRNGVAGKFLASKTGGPRERLKARIAAIGDEIKKKLEDAAATADSGGELSRGQTFDTKKVEELNTLLYDLSRLSQLVKDSSKEGPYRRGSQSWSNPSGPRDKNWGYSSLTDKLAVIQQKLAKLDDGGRYESLVRQALRQAASMV